MCATIDLLIYASTARSFFIKPLEEVHSAIGVGWDPRFYTAVQNGWLRTVFPIATESLCRAPSGKEKTLVGGSLRNQHISPSFCFRRFKEAPYRPTRVSKLALDLNIDQGFGCGPPQSISIFVGAYVKIYFFLHHVWSCWKRWFNNFWEDDNDFPYVPTWSGVLRQAL